METICTSLPRIDWRYSVSLSFGVIVMFLIVVATFNFFLSAFVYMWLDSSI